MEWHGTDDPVAHDGERPRLPRKPVPATHAQPGKASEVLSPT
jgi:hypothetical protein